jgi:hypothetical protein
MLLVISVQKCKDATPVCMTIIMVQDDYGNGEDEVLLSKYECRSTKYKPENIQTFKLFKQNKEPKTRTKYELIMPDYR